MMEETIVYNLFYVASIDAYLVDCYVAEVDNQGRLRYMQAKGVAANIDSFDFEFYGTIHEKIFHLLQDVSPDNLSEKYNRSRNKSTRAKKLELGQLYADPKIKHLLQQYVSNKVSAILKILEAHRLPLCLEVERKVVLESIRIQYYIAPLLPSLFFSKTQTGIQYSLRLKSENKSIICSHHDVKIILNEPGVILIDYQLHSLADINGNKLKPFLKKDTIFVPAHLTETYFSKFILDVAAVADIETDGFSVQKYETIQGVETAITKDYIHDHYVLDVVINYGPATFKLNDPAHRKSQIELSDEGEVSIHQSIRNRKLEQNYIDAILRAGLQRNAAGRFSTPQSEDPFSIIKWLSDHGSLLRENGISVTMPQIDGKSILLNKPVVNLNTERRSDWFDIYGEIVVGEFSIPFYQILPYIEKENPFYPLKDGNFFLIPHTWFTKYSALAKFGQIKENKVAILRSNYTLVENVQSLAPSIQELVVEHKDIDYQVSDLLKAQLRPYQVTGVKWLIAHHQNKLGACLADDMGLGKTLQTLAVLAWYKDTFEVEKPAEEKIDGQLSLFGPPIVNPQPKIRHPLRSLVILPASLVFNWAAEIVKFTPSFKLIEYIGPKRKKHQHNLHRYDIVLTTYHTARRDLQHLQSVDWKYIVLDESHIIKNKESQLFQAIHSLQTDYKISLSGTPIENSLADLWSQMEFINPGMLGSFKFFKDNYLVPIQRQKDEAALDHLKAMVHPFILRRRKEEVVADLPPLTEQVVQITMSSDQQKVYDSELSAARNHLLKMDEMDPSYRFQVFKTLMYLRQMANHPVLANSTYKGQSGKWNMVLDHLDQVIKSRHKILVFSSFTAHLGLFKTYLSDNHIDHVTLTGSHTQNQRKNAVTKFQNDENCSVFLISLKAGGVGLNLTEADYVFILDPWWNPFVEKQAIARAHRIGQKNPVSVFRFISKGTIEEKILLLQAQKQVLSAEIIEGPEQLAITKADLVDLLYP